MRSRAAGRRLYVRQGLRGMSMTDGDGESVGGIAGRQFAQAKQHLDHVLNLILGRVAAAGHRLLHLGG